MVSLRAVPNPQPRVRQTPHLRLLPKAPFSPPVRDRVALRTFVHTGHREMRGVAVRLDENAVEVFGVARGLEIGGRVVAKIHLRRGEMPVWIPGCVHQASPEKTLLWFDRPDPDDIERIHGYLRDLRLGLVGKDGLYSYFHTPMSGGLGRVCVLPPS